MFTARLNTEFYSWDTSFGLVDPRLRYSCLQVVFCVNVGTFFKCFLQLGWKLTGVCSILTECSLNVHWMFTECSLNVHWMFTARLNTEFYSWDTSFGLVNPRLRYSCLQVVFCVNVGTFLSASCSWDGSSRASAQFSLHVHWMFTECSLRDWTRSSTPGIRHLVLWTLVLGTHVCKLYSASTLVLFLSASCSWDGSSRASAQFSLNVHWMFTECSLNVHWMFTARLNTEFYSWDTSFCLVNPRPRYSCL
jgi:hypothetical protein